MDGYVALHPALDEHWVRLHKATSMIKIVGRRFHGLSFQEWPLVPRLLTAALATAHS